MSKLNLILHCGARQATREQIDEVATPEATDTWHPIPHNSLLNMVTERLPKYGLTVTNEAHGLFGDEGERMFSLFQVSQADHQDDDFGLVVGLRNSHDKTFPAGLCCGNGVFVCDNLAFSSEIVVGRRHTKYIMRDLPNLVSAAVGKLMQARIDQARRLEAYKETEITDTQAQSLIIDALRQGAINTTRVPKVVEQWYEPNHPEFKQDGRTVWRLFNGFTETFKPSNPERPGLARLPQLTTRLHGLLDSACGLTGDVMGEIGDQFADNADVLVGREAVRHN